MTRAACGTAIGSCLWLLLALALLLVGSAQAQTRAWLDRDRITLGETTTLNIETDEPAAGMPDYTALEAEFVLSGHASRRSFEQVNGASRLRTLYAVALQPRRDGTMTIPAIRIGGAQTAALPLVVLPAAAATPVRGRGEVFIESRTDSQRPWVQQAVGHVVRVYSAVPLLSGTLEQDAPEGASLRRVGDDAQYTREIDGRRYTVVERRYLLVPERSGTLQVPGARFSGQGVGGYFDRWFGDGRRALRTEGESRRLQVQPPPDNAPLPWLPLRGLQMRWLEAPDGPVQAGEAVHATLELLADGAQAAQIPDLVLPAVEGVQSFAEAAQVEETFVDGRPRLRVVRRFALVADAAGTLQQPGPRLAWWDVAAGVARTASVAALSLQVEGVAAGGSVGADAGNGIGMPPDAEYRWLEAPLMQGALRPWMLVAGLLALVCLGALLRVVPRRRRGGMPALAGNGGAAPRHAGRLAQALASADLAAIEHALCDAARPPATGLDEVWQRLEDAGQRDAVRQLQRTRWQGGDPAAALQALRRAFARGPRWQRADRKQHAEVLPPLYPR